MANAIIDENTKVVEVVKIIYKRPEYLNTAQRKYYNENKSTPEFIEKNRERLKKWRDENRDHVNELARIRRQKKKAEAKAKQEEEAKKQITKEDADLPALETLAV
jgi:hypothetical protein